MRRTRMENERNEGFLVRIEGPIGVMTMNKPASLNALDAGMLDDLLQAIKRLDNDPVVRVLLLFGTEKAFAAGADIHSMAPMTQQQIRADGFIQKFGEIGQHNKPLIACVSGYALGGGFEVALACDMILACETAIFGLPEINLGVIPGGGGTQRLARQIGKALATEMILADRKLDASEAARLGVVNRVYPKDTFVQQCIEFANKIAGKPIDAVMAARSAIVQSDELPLKGGLDYERDLFYALFDTDDQKEGMRAFLEKRKPAWISK